MDSKLPKSKPLVSILVEAERAMRNANEAMQRLDEIMIKLEQRPNPHQSDLGASLNGATLDLHEPSTKGIEES